MQLAPQPASLPSSATQPLLAHTTVDAPAAQAQPATAPAPAAAAPAEPVAVAAQAAAAATPEVPTAPLADASFSTKLLGRVGSAQQKSIQNQQVLGAVSSMLGQRLSEVGERFMLTLRALRGE